MRTVILSYCFGIAVLCSCKTSNTNHSGEAIIKAAANDSDEHRNLRCGLDGYSKVVYVAIRNATNVPIVVFIPDENAQDGRGYKFGNCQSESPDGNKFICYPPPDSDTKKTVEFIHSRETNTWTTDSMPCVGLDNS